MRHGTCDGGHVSAASSSPDSVEQKELAQSAAIIGQAWDSTATGADQDDETRSLNSSLLLILHNNFSYLHLIRSVFFKDQLTGCTILCSMARRQYRQIASPFQIILNLQYLHLVLSRYLHFHQMFFSPQFSVPVIYF